MLWIKKINNPKWLGHYEVAMAFCIIARKDSKPLNFTIGSRIIYNLTTDSFLFNRWKISIMPTVKTFLLVTIEFEIFLA